MKDLFGNTLPPARKYMRDSSGRFTTPLGARIQRAEREATMYRQMYEIELSRHRGLTATLHRLTSDDLSRLSLSDTRILLQLLPALLRSIDTSSPLYPSVVKIKSILSRYENKPKG